MKMKKYKLLNYLITKDSMSSIILLPNKDIDINDYISDLIDDKLKKLMKRMY